MTPCQRSSSQKNIVSSNARPAQPPTVVAVPDSNRTTRVRLIAGATPTVETENDPTEAVVNVTGDVGASTRSAPGIVNIDAFIRVSASLCLEHYYVCQSLTHFPVRFCPPWCLVSRKQYLPGTGGKLHASFEVVEQGAEQMPDTSAAAKS